MSAAFDAKAHREKRVVALSSVGAAVFLTGMKLGVGLWTDSLGLLAEAAHSGLDLVAAIVTLFAVRASARPADRDHTYGHGKVENLSALFETVLLLATCVWIIWEAVERLFFKRVDVQLNAWAFVVLLVSILVDISRSRALARAAHKYRSQALEADALHFSTDVWSSLVVLVGLGLVWLASYSGKAWLAEADAVAALGVACIVVWICVQLGRRSVNDLLDAVPPGLRHEVALAARVPGVVGVRRVRVRQSGPEAFADVTLSVDAATGVEQAHEVATQAENAIREILRGADVVVHVEPAAAGPETLVQHAQRLALRHGLRAHGLRLLAGAGKRDIELHLEVADKLDVREAHELASAFEADLRREVPDLDRVVTHLEPVGEDAAAREAQEGGEANVTRILAEVIRRGRYSCVPHDLKVQRVGGELDVSFHCYLDPDAPLANAHALTERVEKDMRARLPALGRVVIHVEPRPPQP